MDYRKQSCLVVQREDQFMQEEIKTVFGPS